MQAASTTAACSSTAGVAVTINEESQVPPLRLLRRHTSDQKVLELVVGHGQSGQGPSYRPVGLEVAPGIDVTELRLPAGAYQHG